VRAFYRSAARVGGSWAGSDAEENGTDGTARRGATWRPSKASAAGLGVQGKGNKAARFLGAERRHARGQVEQSRASGVVRVGGDAGERRSGWKEGENWRAGPALQRVKG